MRTERLSPFNSVSFATLSVRALFRAVSRDSRSARQLATAPGRDRSERDRSRTATGRDRPPRDRSRTATGPNATGREPRQPAICDRSRIMNYERYEVVDRRLETGHGLIMLSAYAPPMSPRTTHVPTHHPLSEKFRASFIPYHRKELSGGSNATDPRTATGRDRSPCDRSANATGPNATGPRTATGRDSSIATGREPRQVRDSSIATGREPRQVRTRQLLERRKVTNGPFRMSAET